MAEPADPTHSLNHPPEPQPRQALIACPECDLLQHEIALAPGGTALCQRCQAHLYRHTRHGMERALACTIGALILFFLANSFPIIGLELQKTRNATTLLGSVRYLFDHHLQLVAILVLLTTVIIPAIELFAMLAILLPLRLGRVPQGLPWLFRMVQWSHPWGMVEVFMLGIIVSLIRVSDFATVEPGVALFSFAGLMLLMTAGSYNFNRRELWAAVAAIKHA